VHAVEECSSTLQRRNVTVFSHILRRAMRIIANADSMRDLT